MATKKIRRTAIEGGREKRNKAWRRASNRSLRKREHDWMRKVAKDPEVAVEEVEPARWRIDPTFGLRREFADKLAAPEAWLASMSGLPFDVVNARMRAQLDDRTLAGRHLLHDHLMPGITRLGYPAYFGWWVPTDLSAFVVTTDGRFLSVRGKFSRRTSPFDARQVGQREEMSWQELLVRLNGRVVRQSEIGEFLLRPIDPSSAQPTGYRLLEEPWDSSLIELQWEISRAAYSRVLSLANSRLNTFVDRRWSRSVAERFVAHRKIKILPKAPYFFWSEHGRMTRPLTPEEAGTFLQFPLKWQRRHTIRD